MSETVQTVQQLPGIGKIHEAIVAIMAEVGGVGKTRQNTAQNYKFRGIADIKLACQPVMAKHHVYVTPHAVLQEEVAERTTAKGGAMIHVRQRIEFRFYHADGSYFPCVTTGEAMDTGDKASNKAMSMALKYALDQTFCLPEADPDADTEHSSPEIGAKPEPAKPEPPKALPNGQGFTDAEIEEVSTLAKRAGLKKHADLKPLLLEIAGVESLRLLPRKYLDDLKVALEHKADDLEGIGA